MGEVRGSFMTFEFAGWSRELELVLLTSYYAFSSDSFVVFPVLEPCVAWLST